MDHITDCPVIIVFLLLTFDKFRK